MIPASWEGWSCHPSFQEAAIRTFVVSLLGAVCLTAGVVLLRANRADQGKEVKKEVNLIPPGESVPGTIALERLREMGF